MAGGVLADVFKMELARKTRLQLQPSQPESLVALEMAFGQRKKTQLALRWRACCSQFVQFISAQINFCIFNTRLQSAEGANLRRGQSL